jgi:hypothetical protein
MHFKNQLPALRKSSLFDENAKFDSSGRKCAIVTWFKTYRKTQQSVSGFQTIIRILIITIFADN